MNNKDIIIKISGICGISLPILFFSLLLFALQQATWFSWTQNAISDLGRPESGVLCFNYAIIIIGFLLLIFTIGLYLSLDGERVGPSIFALSSIYFMGIGFFPLPDPNHVDVSGLFFIAFPLGYFVIGLQIFRKTCDFVCKMGYFAIIIGIVSLITPVFMYFHTGIAIPEFVIIMGGFIWCLIFGLGMLLNRLK